MFPYMDEISAGYQKNFTSRFTVFLLQAVFKTFDMSLLNEKQMFSVYLQHLKTIVIIERNFLLFC